jgi:hypothetical protein
MLKSTCALVAALAVFASAAVVQANCGNCGAKTTSAETCPAGAGCGEKCTSETCSATQCDAGKGCPIAAAMERLPKLTYAVGEKKTCCPDEAAKIAKDSGGHIHFCVADKEFDSKTEAQEALLTATEQFVASFAEPHKCPKSGQCTLAGQPQSCEKTAAHTAELMKEAMAKVKFTYLVGEKQCECPTEAGKLAKDSGKEKVFVVGEEKTCCEKTARLNLARAKYKAAVEAMLKAQAAATAKPEETAGT